MILCALCDLCAYVVNQLVRFSSTRRFLARPAAVLLDVSGTSGPKPLAVTCVAGTPLASRNVSTVRARANESRRFFTRVPRLSV